MTEEDISRVEPNAEERSGPLGDQPETEPQSIPTEDEERYTVLLTIRPASALVVPGLPSSDQRISADRRIENRLLNVLHAERDRLREAFQGAAERAERAEPARGILPSVRFTLRALRIQKGSITLIAIFGAVYVGVKDYDTLRRGLLLLAEDMKQLLREHLKLALPPWWPIDSEVMVGTRPPLPQSAGASETRADASTAAPQNALRQPGRRGFDWDAKMMFILYLAITNVAVILFLGFLLVRASS